MAVWSHFNLSVFFLNEASLLETTFYILALQKYATQIFIKNRSGINLDLIFKKWTPFMYLTIIININMYLDM